MPYTCRTHHSPHQRIRLFFLLTLYPPQFLVTMIPPWISVRLSASPHLWRSCDLSFCVWLNSLTVLQVCPVAGLMLSLYGWIKRQNIHCIHMPDFLHPFVHWWKSSLISYTVETSAATVNSAIINWSSPLDTFHIVSWLDHIVDLFAIFSQETP